MSRIYNNGFLCEFQLNDYPFDIQFCTMNFTIEEAMKGLVELIPGMFAVRHFLFSQLTVRSAI